MIHLTATVHPKAIVGSKVSIGPYCIIGKGVRIAEGCDLMGHVVLDGNLELGEGCQVFPHVVLGTAPQDLKYHGETTRLVIGKECIFREGFTANRGTEHGGGVTRISDHAYFMANSHVAHDCTIGSHCVMANGVALAGHVSVEDYSCFGGMAGVHQYARIGAYSFVGAGAMVRRDVPPFCVVHGDRARIVGINRIGLERHEFSPERIERIQFAYDRLRQLGIEKGLQELTSIQDDPEGDISRILAFYQKSEQGFCSFKE